LVRSPRTIETVVASSSDVSRRTSVRCSIVATEMPI